MNLFNFKIWKSVFDRIYFFRKMYPLSVVIRDFILFPIDYFGIRKKIRSVRNLTFAITHACNIRCEMCYFHSELHNRKELSLEKFKKAIDEFAISRPCIILSGGEPLMHPNLLEMVEYAKGKLLPVQIFTNGTLVTEQVASRLIDLKLDYINFSLLGPPDIHNRLSKTNNSFEKLLKNLSNLASHRDKTEVLINYTITPQNYRFLNFALEVAEKLNLNGVRFQHYNFLSSKEIQIQAQIMKAEFQLDSITNEIERNSDFNGMAHFLIKWMERHKDYAKIPIQWAPTLSKGEIENWYSDSAFRTNRKCLFPWRGILVDADGIIYPCSKIYLPLGEITGKKSILSVWNGPMMQVFRRKLSRRLYPACSRCCKL